MNEGKKKAAEEKRRREKLVKIANMKFNDEKKIEITYFTDCREAVQE